MNHRLMIFLSVMVSLAVLLVGLWWTILHLTAFCMVDRIMGMMVVTAGWAVVAHSVVWRLASWRGRREMAFPVRAAQPMVIVDVRCEVCDCDEFLEGPHGGLCTNIKCSQCSAEYNYGPGIMERIRRQ